MWVFLLSVLTWIRNFQESDTIVEFLCESVYNKPNFCFIAIILLNQFYIIYFIYFLIIPKIKPNFFSFKIAALTSFSSNFCLIFNSNSQELMQHIHCLRYIFYHQSTIKKNICWFRRFLFSDFYFGSYSCNTPTDLLFISLYSLWLIFATKFLFTLFVFYAHYCHIPKMNTFWLQSNKFSNNHITISFFIWRITSLLESS